MGILVKQTRYEAGECNYDINGDKVAIVDLSLQSSGFVPYSEVIDLSTGMPFESIQAVEDYLNDFS